MLKKTINYAIAIKQQFIHAKKKTLHNQNPKNN